MVPEGETIKWPADITGGGNFFVEPFQNYVKIFPEAMQLHSEGNLKLADFEEAKKAGLIKLEIKREDWYAFDKGTFTFDYEYVPFEKEIKDAALAEEPLPGSLQASDHLPVVVRLIYKQGTPQGTRHRALSVFRAVRRLLRSAKKASRGNAQ